MSIYNCFAIQPDRLPLTPLLLFPRQKTLGEKNDREVSTGQTWRVVIEHTFNSNWMLRQHFFKQNSRTSIAATELDVYGLTEKNSLSDDEHFVRRVSMQSRQDLVSQVSQTELYGHYSLGKTTHQILTGFELGRYRINESGARAPLSELGINMPTYGALPGVFLPVTDQSSENNTQVFYMQDRMHINNHWKVLLGLRTEHVKVQSQNYLDTTSNIGNKRLLSPRLGLVYSTSMQTSLFTSWTQSSRPQLGKATVEGTLLPPEEGQQIEMGIQWKMGKPKLLNTLSLYQLTKRNLATTDLSNPSFSVAGGKQRSRGIELDMRGELLPGFNLDVSFEVLHAKVLHDNDVPNGSHLPGVASWFSSIWLTKNINENWTLGGGVVAEGRRRATWPPSELMLPAYTFVDVSLAYRSKHWRLQTSLGNILARRVYISDGYAIKTVDPRTLMMTLSMSF